MKIIYEANDGTRFDTEYECLSHEQALLENTLSNGVIFFNEKCKRLSTKYNFSNQYGEARFFYIIDVEKAQKVFDIIEEDGTYITPRKFNISRTGAYKIDWDDEEYVYLQDAIEEMQNLINKIQREAEK